VGSASEAPTLSDRDLRRVTAALSTHETQHESVVVRPAVWDQ
jgi:hypothetical protein